MKNALVIIRTYGGQPLIRRIHEITKNAIYVTDDCQKGIVSVGFPLKDVFKYNGETASSIEKCYNAEKWDWNELKPLFE